MALGVVVFLAATFFVGVVLRTFVVEALRLVEAAGFLAAAFFVIFFVVLVVAFLTATGNLQNNTSRIKCYE